MEKEWWASSPCMGDPSLSCVGITLSSHIVVIWCCHIVVVVWLHRCVLAPHHPTILPCRCSVVSVLSTCVVVLCVIIVTCQRMMADVVVHCLVVSEGGWNESAMTHQTGTTNDDQCCHSSFGCHVADGNMAPGFHMIVSIHDWSFGFVGSRLGSWVAIGIHGRLGSLYLVVGIGCHMVAVVGSVVVWWLWWYMEERRNVTHCDISMIFKLTCEITWMISHDNHIVYTVNTPSPGPVLGQPWLRWNSALRAGLSPAKVSPGSPTNLIWPFDLWTPPELCRAQEELQGTIKTSLPYDSLGRFSIEIFCLFHSVISEHDKTPTHVFTCLPAHNEGTPSQTVVSGVCGCTMHQFWCVHGNCCI